MVITSTTHPICAYNVPVLATAVQAQAASVQVVSIQLSVDKVLSIFTTTLVLLSVQANIFKIQAIFVQRALLYA